jgi:SAM-dependent methyltransferase
MAESSSGKLRIWSGWVPTLEADVPRPDPGVPAAPGPEVPPASADHLAALETLRTHHRLPEGVEPFSLQWFLDIETIRHGRQGKWIAPLLEFTKHAGETLLGLGLGLGTDWLQYARHGAEVIACCPDAEQLGLVQKNFALRGLGGAFLHAAPTALPLESASIDVACVTNLLHEAADPPALVDEVYRVLKPGGKVLAVAPAYYDIHFWRHTCFPWQRWRRPRHPGGPSAAFSGRRLRRLFARFCEPRVYKRHLRRAEIPHLWRWCPIPVLERLVGCVLIFKAFKPLSAAIAAPLAA